MCIHYPTCSKLVVSGIQYNYITIIYVSKDGLKFDLSDVDVGEEIYDFVWKL